MKLIPLGSNKTELEINGATILFSYQTPVAANYQGAFYRTAEHYSVTTSKHINQWLDGRKAEENPQAWFDTLANQG